MFICLRIQIFKVNLLNLNLNLIRDGCTADIDKNGCKEHDIDFYLL